MGSIFSFVASDLKDKIGILEELQKADSTGNFSTFKKMVNYERDNGLLNKQGYVSGSRTLLRLHRGLDFIRLFLKQIEELKAEEKTVKACQDAYNCTLAKYHGWLIRKSAVLAMHALPTREALLIKVCGSREEIERGVQVLPKMLEVTAEAYKRTDDLYTACDLHGLP
ncbi:unnamed protein product [Timema podura]|uniref:Glycolipid transfer protein domain-containing protein n=1 Tax=Timema podura TaxID=61482 RepID=A0ABN7PKW5_TIMPD|nr:unnamed protein product [Timema podura]